MVGTSSNEAAVRFGSVASWLAVSLSKTESASAASGWFPDRHVWLGPGSNVCQSFSMSAVVWVGASFCTNVSSVVALYW